MNKDFYALKQHYQYLNPGIRGLIFLDFQFETGLNLFKSQVKKYFQKEQLFYWLPRAAGILFIAFISLFALDAFSSTQPLLLNLIAFLIHLIPSFILIIMLIIAWKHEKLGGLIFITSFMVIFAFLIIKKPVLNDLFVFGPLFLIGTLFIIDSYIKYISRR